MDIKLIYEIKLTNVSANSYQSAHFAPILSYMDVLSWPLASHSDAQGINVHTMKRRQCQVQMTLTDEAAQHHFQTEKSVLRGGGWGCMKGEFIQPQPPLLKTLFQIKSYF